MAQQLIKIIIQKMPLDKNGDLVFDVDEAQELHNNAVQMLKRAIGIDVLTTFADVDVADLNLVLGKQRQDQIQRAFVFVYLKGEFFHLCRSLSQKCRNGIQKMKDGAAQEGKGTVQPAQEQDEEHRKDDVALILHDLVVKVGGQHRGDDAAAVQRRDGDEVKDRQVDVQQAHDGKDLRDGVGGGKADSQHGIQEEAPQLVQNQAEERQNDIGGGTGQRGKDHALFDVFEIPGCNRHRLGPAKPGKNHQDGAKHIQVRQGWGRPAYRWPRRGRIRGWVWR